MISTILRVTKVTIWVIFGFYEKTNLCSSESNQLLYIPLYNGFIFIILLAVSAKLFVHSHMHSYTPELLAGFDFAWREEADAREAQVLVLHEHAHRDQIRLAQMVDEAADVTILPRIDTICLTILKIRNKSIKFLKESLTSCDESDWYIHFITCSSRLKSVGKPWPLKMGKHFILRPKVD